MADPTIQEMTELSISIRIDRLPGGTRRLTVTKHDRPILISYETSAFECVRTLAAACGDLCSLEFSAKDVAAADAWEDSDDE